MTRAASALALVALVFLHGTPASARFIVVDTNWTEVQGDADNGQSVNLSFPVDYGTGAQTAVTVNIADAPSGTSPVGLTFADGSSLWANLYNASNGSHVLMTANDSATSSPRYPVSSASIFRFGSMPDMAFGSPCDVIDGHSYCYATFSGTASFQFTDLSSSGMLGDFGLTLFCESLCSDIGFNLGGLSFDANSFDPAAAPSQLVSSNVVRNGNFILSSSFEFVFRNAVPEPATWASMLLGFGLLGGAMRRERRLKLRTS